MRLWVGRKINRTGEKLIRPNSYASFSIISKLHLDFILHGFRISAHSLHYSLLIGLELLSNSVDELQQLPLFPVALVT